MEKTNKMLNVVPMVFHLQLRSFSPDVILDVLPTAIAVRDDAGQEPVVVPSMPDLIFATGHGSFLFVQPQRMQLCETTVGDIEHELTFRFHHFCLAILRVFVFIIFLLKMRKRIERYGDIGVNDSLRDL